MVTVKKYVAFIFSVVKYVLYNLTDSVSSGYSGTSSGRNLLIIKLDEIGDYILFRNFLGELKSSDKYKGFRFILCGSSAWKEISERADSSFIDEFIWINKKKFLSDLLYRRSILKQISSLELHAVINYSHSRTFYTDDSIARAASAGIKIGDTGDLSNSFRWQKKISDRFYTKLINTEEERFEFNKNRLFTDKLTGEKSTLVKPSLPGDLFTDISSVPGNYILAAPGARYSHKRWNKENFEEALRHLPAGFSVIFAGSREERKFVPLINSESRFQDFTGSTTLTELISLIKKAQLVFSNDSGIVHAAAALNIPAVILHNGTHYGRFLPYPDEMNIPQIVLNPPQVKAMTEQEKERVLHYRSYYDINSIPVTEAVEAMNRMLSVKR